jgi:hypothetical protein
VLRKEDNKKLKKDGKDIVYPSFEDLTKEDNERETFLVFVIKNAQGEIIRQLTSNVSKGLNRLNWDMKVVSKSLITDAKDAPYKTSGAQLVTPGKYSVSIFLNRRGQWIDLEQTENFEIVAYPNYSKEMHNEMFAFQEEVNEFNTLYSAFNDDFAKTKKRLKLMQKAYYTAQKQDKDLYNSIVECQDKMDAMQILISGNPSISKRNANQEASLNDRFGLIRYTVSSYTGAPTGTIVKELKIVKNQFALIEADYKKIKAEKIDIIENGLKAIGAVSISQ